MFRKHSKPENIAHSSTSTQSAQPSNQQQQPCRQSSWYSQPGIEDQRDTNGPPVPSIPDFGNPWAPKSPLTTSNLASHTQQSGKAKLKYNLSSSSKDSWENEAINSAPRSATSSAKKSNRSAASQYLRDRSWRLGSLSGPELSPKGTISTNETTPHSSLMPAPLHITPQQQQIPAPSPPQLHSASPLSRFIRRASSSAGHFGRKPSTATDCSYPRNSWEAPGEDAEERSPLAPAPPKHTVKYPPSSYKTPAQSLQMQNKESMPPGLTFAATPTSTRSSAELFTPQTPTPAGLPYHYAKAGIQPLPIKPSNNNINHSRPATTPATPINSVLQRGLMQRYRPVQARAQPITARTLNTKTRDPQQCSDEGLYLRIGTLRGPRPQDYLALQDVMKKSLEKRGGYEKGVKEVRKWLKGQDRWTVEWVQDWLTQFER
ncbi:hypothetical protein LTR66_016148 [Elasticomyces elasticus]|nr:hypothetical protein LTR66_016148 [Elasticomyces elasticus]